MAVADWKPVHQEPEDYGVYLVKVKDKAVSTMARFDQPGGEREMAWFELTLRGFVKIEVTHWDYMPS